VRPRGRAHTGGEKRGGTAPRPPRGANSGRNLGDATAIVTAQPHEVSSTARSTGPPHEVSSTARSTAPPHEVYSTAIATSPEPPIKSV